jgi:hypothetical protein
MLTSGRVEAAFTGGHGIAEQSFRLFIFPSAKYTFVAPFIR